MRNKDSEGLAKFKCVSIYRIYGSMPREKPRYFIIIFRVILSRIDILKKERLNEKKIFL